MAEASTVKTLGEDSVASVICENEDSPDVCSPWDRCGAQYTKVTIEINSVRAEHQQEHECEGTGTERRSQGT